MKFLFPNLRLIYCFPLLLLLFTTISCNSNDEPGNEYIIAEVSDDYSLYFPFIQAFHSNHEFAARFPDSELQGYEEVIDYLVTNHLKFIDFFEQEMHRDPDLEYEMARLINEDLLNEYFEENYLSNYINESAIDRYYRGMQKKIHYRQIVLPLQSQSAESRREIDETIQDILEAISEGEDFGQLMNLYSREAQQSGSARGVRSIRGDADRTSPLFAQLYDLNQGDVKVLETGTSMLVIRVDNVERIDTPPKETVRNEIVRSLRQIHYRDTYREFRSEKENIITLESANWNEEVLEQLSEWSAQPQFFVDRYQTVLNDEISAGRDSEILSYNGRTVNFSDLLLLLDTILIPERSRGMSSDQLKEFLVEAIQKEQIVRKAREMGLDENILNAQRQNPALRNRVIQLYDREVIDSEIPEVTEERLREFYDKYRDSLFSEPEKVNLFAHLYDTREEAEAAWERYESGIEFEDLERGYAVRTFIRNDDGEIESFMRREPPYLGEAAFSIEQGEVYGPVEFTHGEQGEQFAIVKSANREEARTLEYSDIEQRVESEFRSYHRREISSRVKEDLWNRYPVTIHRDRLVSHIQGIQSS